MTQDLLAYFNTRTESMVSLLERLVRYESPSRDKTLVDTLSLYLHDILIELGADVTLILRENVGDIRLAKWNTDKTGQPILLLAHLDTVWPAGTLETSMPLRRDESKLSGPGVLDMKAGVVIALEAIRGLRELNQLPHCPLWLLLTTDEETSSIHSRELIVELAKQCRLVLVMEPAADNGGLKTSRKGISEYTVKAQGVASHAGLAPEAGVNAVVELAHQTLKIHSLNNLRQGTSVSVTQVSGGITSNIIPPEASCCVDVRFFYKEEAERVDEAIKALTPVLPGSSLEITGGIGRLPMERTEQVVNLFQQVRQIAERLGFSLDEAAVGGVSDGNLTAGAGIPTLDGLGAQGAGAHAVHEHILIRSLPRKAALLAAILREI